MKMFYSSREIYEHMKDEARANLVIDRAIKVPGFDRYFLGKNDAIEMDKRISPVKYWIRLCLRESEITRRP